jgi:hypothetical protein
LNGAKNIRISGNLLKAPTQLLQRRTEDVVTDTQDD